MKSFKQFVVENTEHPMIDVDGVQKHRNNSEGQPIHHTEEGIRNFHRWAGGNEVKDDHGRPKVLYHGSKHSFDEFKKTKGTVSTVFGSEHVEREGHFLSHDRSFAHTFGDKVMSVYARTKKPFDIRKGVTPDHEDALEQHGVSSSWMHNHQEHWERFDGEDGKHFVGALKKAGYDSAMITEPHHVTNKSTDTHVVFHPNDVKSTKNDGTFSPHSPVIHR